MAGKEENISDKDQTLPVRKKSLLGKIRREYSRDSLEYEFLPPALEIEETPPSPTRRILIWVIFAVMISTFLWTYFGEVDEVAVAQGKIIPDGKVKVIQPVEMGVIRAIHVSDGQKVREGQLLIEIDPTINQADVESTVKNLSINLTDKQRLKEELTGRSAGLRGSEGKQVSPEIRALQEQLKEANNSGFRAKVEAQRSVIEQRKDTLKSAEAILEKLRKTRDVVREEAAAYEAAYKEDYISRIEHLGKQKELYTLEQEYEAQKTAVQQAKEGIQEAQQTLSALIQEHDKQILGEILEREKHITALEGEMVKARKRFELEKLTAPVTGTVHGLQSYTIGGVVTPAQPIVTIVPEGTRLIIEADAENKDIGFIKVGQKVEIKLDTFPFQKYGTVKGTVTFVSPDAFETEKKGLVYKIKVALEKETIVIQPAQTEVVYVPTYYPTAVYGAGWYYPWRYPALYAPPPYGYGYGAVAFGAGSANNVWYADQLAGLSEKSAGPLLCAELKDNAAQAVQKAVQLSGVGRQEGESHHQRQFR
ncbi:MAG: HlyD family type I secretion periplasmic adaptor subunit, partial [Nitrospirales bacterium]|nr:HlyD family type I secretion periplasmic adaptor subunit [Nitrospirales bacterium]